MKLTRWVHAKYRETNTRLSIVRTAAATTVSAGCQITPIILSGVLGLLMAFIVYGRMVLKPIF